MLFRHLVIAANYSSFEQGPERFNRVGMNRADNILAFAVVYGSVIVVLAEQAIAAVLIGRNERDALAHGFVNKAIQRTSISILDNLRANSAAPLDSTDHNCLASGSRQSLA